MSGGDHREVVLAFPAAPPGTCQSCGTPTTNLARMHPWCRQQHQDGVHHRRASLRKAGPVKFCAMVGYASDPCSPYDPATGDGLESDHLFRLADGGPHDATRLLCVHHHQQKTVTENRKGRDVAQDARQAQDVRRQGHGFALFLLLCLNLTLLSLAWVHRWTWRLGLYTGLEMAGLGMLWLLARRRRRRRIKAQFVVTKVARFLNLPDVSHRHLRRVTWDGDFPVAGVIRYGFGFNDVEPSQDMDRAEALLLALADRPLFFEWHNAKSELHWWPAADRFPGPEDEAPLEPEPELDSATSEQKRVESAIGESVAAALASREGERANCATTVAEWRKVVDDEGERDHPMELRITYPPAAAKKVVGAEVEIVDAVAAIELPVGEWKPKVDRRQLLIVVRDRPDPLDQLIAHAPVDPEIDLTVGPIIGLDENLQSHREPAIAKSTFIAGESGSGKASIQWGMLRGIAPFIHHGLIRLWVINPKPEEFASLADAAYRYATRPQEIADLLEEARAALEADQDWMVKNGVRKRVAGTKTRPLNYLLGDELAMFTAYVTDSRLKRQNQANVGAIVTQSRSAGWGTLWATQDPRSEVVKMRPIFNRQIGLRLAEADATRQVLGSAARAAGALCDRINPNRPGTFYVVDEDFKGFKRVRTAYTSDDEVLQIAAYLARKADTLEAA